MNLVIDALGWTLVHSLWQALLIAALLGAAQQVLCSAQARYAAAGLALVAVLTGAIVTCWLQLRPIHPTPATVTLASEPSPAPSPETAIAPAATTEKTPVEPPSASTLIPVPAVPALHADDTAWPWLKVLVAGWALGVLVFSLRIFRNGLRLRRIRRDAERVDSDWQARFDRVVDGMQIRIRVSLRCTVDAVVPMVVGILKPVVIVPASMLAEMPVWQIEAILAHEVAHVRRNDYLVNLLQNLIETLFFYHPAVWWISARIRAEREDCCDDAAARRCGDSVGYARALTALEELRGRPLAGALSASGGSLHHRVQRILGVRQGDSFWPGFSVLLLLAAWLAAAQWAPSEDTSPQPEEPATREAAADASADISVTDESSEDRLIRIGVQREDAAFYRLSEDPKFVEYEDVAVDIRIDRVDPSNTFADISITYPGGKPGEPARPFGMPEGHRDYRVLAVLATFEGELLKLPEYATTGWLHKLVFGDPDGFDGLGSDNSFQAHLEQNSYGRVRLAGEVFPEVVKVPYLERYRQPGSSRTDMLYDVANHLVGNYPAYFKDRRYEALMVFTPGMMHAMTNSSYTTRNYTYDGKLFVDKKGVFRRGYIQDLALDSRSILYGPTITQTLAASSPTTVVPRFNPRSVKGVWLASDTERTGTNYYSGGRILSLGRIGSVKHVELGTPLPKAGVEVDIEYTATRPKGRLTAQDMLMSSREVARSTYEVGLMFHEMYHVAGEGIARGRPIGIGDLYIAPRHYVGDYGVMASGSHNYRRVPPDQRVTEPAQMSAFMKYQLGYLQPLTLAYGTSVASVRLHKTEEADLTGSEGRTKLVKIPLRPAGSPRLMQLYKGFNNTVYDLEGEEYLLLEWRYKGELEAGGHNFDAALPHEGLLVYYVIDDGGPLSTHGKLVHLVDATPPEGPFSSLKEYGGKRYVSMGSSPLPFGPDSGKFRCQFRRPPSQMGPATTSAPFLLSEGAGPKTVYAQFFDVNNKLIAEDSVSHTGAMSDRQWAGLMLGDEALRAEGGIGCPPALDGRRPSDPSREAHRHPLSTLIYRERHGVVADAAANEIQSACLVAPSTQSDPGEPEENTPQSSGKPPRTTHKMGFRARETTKLVNSGRKISPGDRQEGAQCYDTVC